MKRWRIIRRAKRVAKYEAFLEKHYGPRKHFQKGEVVFVAGIVWGEGTVMQEFVQDRAYWVQLRNTSLMVPSKIMYVGKVEAMMGYYKGEW